MGVDRTIDITTGQRKTILELLERHLPDTVAWVYGSRAKWTSRPQSDLDLVVFATPHQRSRIGALREAFEESDLPFRIDLFVWDEVPETFREQIELEHVVLAANSTPSTSRNSALAGEWTESTLGEVADFVSGGTPAKSHVEYWGGSIPWVSAKDMKRFKLDDTEDHVTEAGVENGTKLVPEGTVLLLTRGMTLMNDVPICVAQRPMTFNQDVKALRPKPGTVPEYLPYLLLGNKQRLLLQVDLAGHGTGRLNSDELKTLDILLPAFPEGQRTIAHILGTLDDKTELNRSMSETLQEMARTLFKEWFVDFGPVRAKMALKHHSLLGGKSARKRRNPPSSRWGDVRRRYSRQTLDRAKALRRNQSDAEGLLWCYLRNRQLDGYKFRRQHPVGPYIADFACLPAKLFIELDGGHHIEQAESDAGRGHFLRSEGYRVLRFRNSEVFGNCFAVLKRIHGALSLPPPRQPAAVARPSTTPPQGGGDWSVERARAYLDTMDPAIADLFPDRFVHSELGEIPEGWQVSNVADLSDLNPEVWTKRTRPPEIRYVDLSSTKWGRIETVTPYTSTEAPSRAQRVLQLGDTIVGTVRPGNGSYALVSEPGLTGSTGFAVLRPRRAEYAEFVYLAATSADSIHVLAQLADGAAYPAVRPEVVAATQIVRPDRRLLAQFSSAAGALLGRIVHGEKESGALVALRDTLLPMLVSGELRIEDGERFIESAA